MWALICFIIICWVGFSNIDITAKAILMVAAGIFALAESVSHKS